MWTSIWRKVVFFPCIYFRYTYHILCLPSRWTAKEVFHRCKMLLDTKNRAFCAAKKKDIGSTWPDKTNKKDCGWPLIYQNTHIYSSSWYEQSRFRQELYAVGSPFVSCFCVSSVAPFLLLHVPPTQPSLEQAGKVIQRLDENMSSVLGKRWEKLNDGEQAEASIPQGRACLFYSTGDDLQWAAFIHLLLCPWSGNHWVPCRFFLFLIFCPNCGGSTLHIAIELFDILKLFP